MSVETTTRLPASRSNYPLLVLKSKSKSKLDAGGFHSALLGLSKPLPTLGKSSSKRKIGENPWEVGPKSVVLKRGKEVWRGGERRMGQFEGLLQYKKRLESYFSVGRRDEEPSGKIDVSVSLSSLSVQSFSPPRFRPYPKFDAIKPVTRGDSQRSSQCSGDFSLLLAPCGDAGRGRFQQNSKKSQSRDAGQKRTASNPLDWPKALHYQQFFLHSSPSPALLMRLPTLTPLSLPRTAHSGLVLAILFDGVLGDLHRACPYDDSPYQLRLRAKATEGLKALQTHFRLVLICSFSRKLCYCVVSNFRACGVRLEACYRLRFPKEDWCRRQFLCYNRLESDLRIGDFAGQIMTLNALRLSQEDLQGPNDTLICTKKGTKWSVNAEFVPVSLPARELPISCWVPDLQSKAVPFDRLAESIMAYFSLCSTDWSSGFTAISANSDLSTAQIGQLFLSQVLPIPTAASFREQVSKSPHSRQRLIWGKQVSPPSFRSRVMLVNPCEYSQPCEVVQEVKWKGLSLW